jgi:hypothetical protein
MDLYVEDLRGNQYFALGAVEEKARVNGEKEITVSFIENKVNSKFIKLIDHRWIIGYEGEEYVVLFPRKRTKGSKKIVEAPAIHKFFVDMRDSQQYKVQNGSKTFSERLQFIFEDTGYAYNIVDNFYAQEMENFGDADRLELFQQTLNQYEAEFEIVNNIIYLKNRIGIDSNAFYEHKVNLTDIQIDNDGTSFATYGRGYGKIKDETDGLSSTKIPYASRTGMYYIESSQNKRATKQVGASFTFTFTGTGFTFYTLAHPLGGVWEFNVAKNTKLISTYQNTTVYKTYEICRGLEDKTHTVYCTFRGDDKNNPNTKGTTTESFNYLLDGDIITLYKTLVGDEIYTCTAEYTSPLASMYEWKYGLIELPAIRDEKYTNKDSLYQRVKREVDDSLKVAITVNGTKLKVTNPGDRIFLMDSRVDLDLEVRVIEVTKRRDINGELLDHSVMLSNDGILKSYQSRMQTAAKQIQNLLEGRGRIPFNVLPSTVKAYSEALAKAQTEILFENGLLAVSKLDPNDIVLFNSAGLGISVDGGQTFKTAITAQGIVADVITTGQLNANNVRIFGGDGNSYTIIEGAYAEWRGQFARTWRGKTKNYDTSIRVEHGYIRFRSNTDDRSLYMWDGGISTYADGDGDGAGSSGTIEWFSDEYDSGQLGITMSSSAGIAAVKSESHRVHLDAGGNIELYSRTGFVNIWPEMDNVGNNLFSFQVTDDDDPNNTDGLLKYGTSAGTDPFKVALRFKKAGEPIVYVTNNAGERGTGILDAYEVRAQKVSNKGGREPYWNGQGGGNLNTPGSLEAGGIRSTATDFWIGTPGTVRCVATGGYNDGNPQYKPIAALEFITASSSVYKTNIREYDEDPIAAGMGTNIYTYDLVSNVEAGIYDRRKLGILAEGAPPYVRSENGVDVNALATLSLAFSKDQQPRIEAVEADTKEQWEILANHEAEIEELKRQVAELSAS